MLLGANLHQPFVSSSRLEKSFSCGRSGSVEDEQARFASVHHRLVPLCWQRHIKGYVHGSDPEQCQHYGMTVDARVAEDYDMHSWMSTTVQSSDDITNAGPKLLVRQRGSVVLDIVVGHVDVLQTQGEVRRRDRAHAPVGLAAEHRLLVVRGWARC